MCVLSGLTNTVTAVKNAQMAESPVLLIGGAAATLLKVRNIAILGKKYLRDLIKSKSPEPMQKDHLIKRFQSQMKNQQDLLQFMKQKQQTLLQKTEDMEQSIERIKRPQTVASAPFPGAMDNPQSTPRLSPADHLVQVLEQGGDRAALAQWSAVGVKITAASQNRIHRGDTAGVALEPTQAGASFLVFQSMERICLCPIGKPWAYSSAIREGTLDCLCLSRSRRNQLPRSANPPGSSRRGSIGGAGTGGSSYSGLRGCTGKHQQPSRPPHEIDALYGWSAQSPTPTDTIPHTSRGTPGRNRDLITSLFGGSKR